MLKVCNIYILICLKYIFSRNIISCNCIFVYFSPIDSFLAKKVLAGLYAGFSFCKNYNLSNFSNSPES